jgi:hypothetical protein
MTSVTVTNQAGLDAALSDRRTVIIVDAPGVAGRRHRRWRDGASASGSVGVPAGRLADLEGRRDAMTDSDLWWFGRATDAHGFAAGPAGPF